MSTDAADKKNWHHLSVESVIGELHTDAENGLTESEANARRERYGPNHLPEAKKPGMLRRFLKQFHNVLIYVLLAAAIITFLMGHYVDTAVILMVVVVNALIGFIQENRAEAAMEGIKTILALDAHVIRNGKRMEVSAEDVTPGDLVRLSPGDKIPADLRLVQADNLKIEEAVLTGEAVPADKETEVLPEDTVLGDRTNLAFSGTSVSAGTGLGVVVGIGESTEVGGISSLLDEVDPTTTPLIRQMDRLSRNISLVILAVALAVYIFGRLFREYDHGVLALSVIGLAIGAIPEGLPAIMSIILALGVQSMAKRHAIVRNLPSVETLGSVSVICSDKTGTLTRNEMTVTDLATRDAAYGVEGAGYAPEGDITRDGTVVAAVDQPVLAALLRAFRICNESELSRDAENRWTVKGAPTEGALLAAYEKSGLDLLPGERVDVIPFDSAYKYMAVLVEGEGEEVLYIKGAPDRLLEMAESEETASGPAAIDREFWETEVSRLARQGRRTIAAGYKRVPAGTETIDHGDVGGGVVLLGIAGIVDPPREEAIAAVRECQEAGITVKMITGDHIETALAIACQMGIGDGENAIEGRELDKLDEAGLKRAASKYDVFARTSPENKLQLVRAIQSNGDVCAMTGDGVNDAPALKTADVGIAMGIKGTEVTKEAAEIVLADDNFATIAAAVEEGRKVFDNLKKSILFILPTNGAECFLIMLSILFGTFMPLTPVQILWVNMVTSVTVSLALAFEPLDPEAMSKPPRDPGKSLLDAYFIWRILYVSLLIGGGTLLLTVLLARTGKYDEATLRTITMQAIVFSQMFHLFNNRSLRRSAFCCGFFTNKAVFVVSILMAALQLGITYLPFMNRIFGTTPLQARHWVYPFVLGMVVFFVVEGEKWVMRRLDERRAARTAPRSGRTAIRPAV